MPIQIIGPLDSGFESGIDGGTAICRRLVRFAGHHAAVAGSRRVCITEFLLIQPNHIRCGRRLTGRILFAAHAEIREVVQKTAENIIAVLSIFHGIQNMSVPEFVRIPVRRDCFLGKPGRSAAHGQSGQLEAGTRVRENDMVGGNLSHIRTGSFCRNHLRRFPAPRA